MKHRRLIALLIAMAAGAAGFPVTAEVTVKLREISFIDGLKDNQVFGYGLVVGLPGTGDTKKSPLAGSSLKNLLKNLGMEGDEIVSQNSAAVLITAQLPPFVRVGDRIDITVSSIGDAKSLEGGILVQSSLKGADGQTYVVAQGTLSQGRGKGNERKFVRTVAAVPGGGVVEREISPEVVKDNAVFLVLKNWDYGLATEIVKAVAEKYPESKPEVVKGSKIKINLLQTIPLAELVAGIEALEMTPQWRATVVVNERDGTIVTGGEVKISEALVSREGLTVQIKEGDRKVSAAHLRDSSNVKDLVDALNAIGASTGDIIAILKALKSSGALHAELIVR